MPGVQSRFLSLAQSRSRSRSQGEGAGESVGYGILRRVLVVYVERLGADMRSYLAVSIAMYLRERSSYCTALPTALPMGPTLTPTARSGHTVRLLEWRVRRATPPVRATVGKRLQEDRKGVRRAMSLAARSGGGLVARIAGGDTAQAGDPGAGV